MPEAVASTTVNGDLIKAAMPFWYSATGTKTIERNDGAGDRTVVSALRADRIKVVPTVTDGVGTAGMLKILTDHDRRIAHRKRLVRLVMDNGYQGVNLDYESMAWGVGSDSAADRLRHGFTKLVKSLGRRLHERDKFLSVAVIAKTSPSASRAASVFGYRGLGHAVNRFQVMTYDYHWSGGAPGAVAPVDWQRRVMAFTTSRVKARKVELGVPGYGYDWGRSGRDANSVTFPEAMRLARVHEKSIQWDDESKSPHFAYRKDGVRHEVWFMNGRAVKARLRLVERFGLAGIAQWAFGYEDPKQWVHIRDYATSTTA